MCVCIVIFVNAIIYVVENNLNPFSDLAEDGDIN
jgi:hypothetical protein